MAQFNVLFLCTGNSARSILAEGTLNHLAVGRGTFHAYRKTGVLQHAVEIGDQGRAGDAAGICLDILGEGRR